MKEVQKLYKESSYTGGSFLGVIVYLITEDIWQCLDKLLVVTARKGLPLASSGYRPRMPLHIL